jgi:hypothetical protein
VVTGAGNILDPNGQISDQLTFTNVNGDVNGLGNGTEMIFASFDTNGLLADVSPSLEDTFLPNLTTEDLNGNFTYNPGNAGITFIMAFPALPPFPAPSSAPACPA